jgi:hypothetical protein
MSTKFSDELLSAYFDGETSPEEDALVEQALENSTELRRRLDEVGQVSDLLRSLPTETAPPELPAAVRKQIERELLLPAPTSAAPRRLRMRSGLAVACGAAISAAAILLIVMNGAPVRDALPLAGNQLQHRVDAVEAELADAAGSPAFDREDAERPSAERPPRGIRPEGRPPAAPALTMQPAERPRSAAQAESNRVPADSVPPPPSPSRGGFADDVKVGTLKPGDVVRYLETSGEEVTVLEVTVIDVQRALGALQVLFAKNAIVADAETAATAEKTASRDGNRLHAVYVEATDDQLASTLNEMTSPDIFVEIKRHSTVTIEELQAAQETETARRQFARLQSRRGSAGASRVAPAVNDVAHAQTKPRDADVAADDERTPTDSKAKDDAQSFQVLVTLPTETLQESARRAGEGRRTAPAAKSDSAHGPIRSQPMIAKSRPQLTPPGEQQLAPLRVVFVLHEQQ